MIVNELYKRLLGIRYVDRNVKMGLGIKKDGGCYVVFLAKQCWKVLIQPENVWVQLVKLNTLRKISNLQCKKI